MHLEEALKVASMLGGCKGTPSKGSWYSRIIAHLGTDIVLEYYGLQMVKKLEISILEVKCDSESLVNW